MEFVNANFKQKQQNARKPRNGTKYYENGNGTPSKTHLTHNQYEQFVSNAIQMGRGGGYNGQINGISSQETHGLLQALQQQQQPSNGGGDGVQQTNNLGNMFQELAQKSKHKEQKKNVYKNSAGGGVSSTSSSASSVLPGLNFSNAVKANKISQQGLAAPAPLATSTPNQPSQTQEEMTLRLNNEALLRVDPCFVRLYGSASQVAIYDFEMNSQDWVDTKTVGCLFLYSRSTSPEYGLVVLNRKGLKNLVMFFDKQSQVILHQPFLLFRRGPDEVIKSIWFYKETEFHDATKVFRTLGVQFDQCDAIALPGSQKTNNANITAAAPNLFDLLKESQKKVDQSSNPGSKSKVITAEELEQQMFSDPSPPAAAAGVLHGLKNSMEASGACAGGAELLGKLAVSKIQVDKGSKVGESTRKPTTSGDSDSTDSLPPALKVANRAMKTVEQLEKDLMPEALKSDMSNELLATLGIAPIKDAPESSSEIYSPESPFLTPTSRSISESERSQKKLTIDDLDGKLYEETDEEMVQDVVEGLADLTELLLLSENVPGFSEPQLVWRKRSNLQNRPPSALIQVPHTNGNGVGQNHQKHAVMNNSPSLASPSMSPLTQGQLLQAITYLLQTDPSFISKIHDGYIKSLQQTWANNRLG